MAPGACVGQDTRSCGGWGQGLSGRVCWFDQTLSSRALVQDLE